MPFNEHQPANSHIISCVQFFSSQFNFECFGSAVSLNLNLCFECFCSKLLGSRHRLRSIHRHRDDTNENVCATQCCSKINQFPRRPNLRTYAKMLPKSFHHFRATRTEVFTEQNSYTTFSIISNKFQFSFRFCVTIAWSIVLPTISGRIVSQQNDESTNQFTSSIKPINFLFYHSCDVIIVV